MCGRSRPCVAVLQETKITDLVFAARNFKGYLILVTAADSDRRLGGVALLVRETNYFTVENEKAVGPNVISLKLVTGRRKNERWYVVGCYLPPSDKEGEAHRRTKAALEAQPTGTRLLLLGNLNAGLDCPWTRRRRFWRPI